MLSPVTVIFHTAMYVVNKPDKHVPQSGSHPPIWISYTPPGQAIFSEVVGYICSCSCSHTRSGHISHIYIMIHGHHQMCSTQPAEYPKPQQSLVAFQSPSRLLPESISEVSFHFRQYATHNTLVCGKSIISQTSLCYLPPRQGRWFTENISSQKEITCSRFSLARVIAPVSPERQKHEGVKFSELSFVPFLGKVMQDPVKAPLHPSHVLNINFKHSPRTTEAHVRVID